MNKKLIQLLRLDAKASDEQIVAAVQTLQSRLDAFEKTEAQRAADEKIIIEKMARGLSREQAVHVIQRQREFEAGREKSKVQGPKSSPSRRLVASKRSEDESAAEAEVAKE